MNRENQHRPLTTIPYESTDSKDTKVTSTRGFDESRSSAPKRRGSEGLASRPSQSMTTTSEKKDDVPSRETSSSLPLNEPFNGATTNENSRTTRTTRRQAKREQRRAEKMREIETSTKPSNEQADTTQQQTLPAVALDGNESSSSSKLRATQLSTSDDTSNGPKIRRQGQREQREQRRAEKMRKMERAVTETPEAKEEVDANRNEQSVAVMPHNDARPSPHTTNPDIAHDEATDQLDELDDFAAAILAQQEQNQEKGTQQGSHEKGTTTMVRSSLADEPAEKSLFEIDVLANELHPSQRADIIIRGLDRSMEGLLTILQMALNVQHWIILQITLPTIEEADGSSTQQQEEGIDEESTSSQQSERRIVVRIPPTEGSGTHDELLNGLRLLLLSACDDFVSPRRSLKPLIAAFERSIEPNDTDSSDTENNRRGLEAQKLAGTQNQASGSNSVAHNEAGASTTQGPTERRTPSFGVDVDTVRPGAVAATGRAFGAPVRRSHNNNSNNRQQQTRRTSRFTAGLSSRLNRLHSRIHSRFGGRSSWISRRGVSGGMARNGRESSSHEAADMSVPIAAEVVQESDPKDLEADIRSRLMAEAACASVVDPNELTAEHTRMQRKWFVGFGVLAVLLIGAVVGLTVGLTSTMDDKNTLESDGKKYTLDPTTTVSSAPSGSPSVMPSLTPSSNPTDTPPPTLTAIQDRGWVRCSVGPDNFVFSRLEAKLCCALAAAVLGDPTKVELYQNHPKSENYRILDNGTVDVLINTMPHILVHSLSEPTTGKTFQFSTPYFYGGLVFGGLSAEFVDCANQLDTFFGSCRRLIVCAVNTTTHTEFLRLRLPNQNFKIVHNLTDVFQSGACNMIGADASVMTESLHLAAGLMEGANFSIGSNTFTTEPYSIVTRSYDNEWTTFVETVLQGLMEAERRDITQQPASRFPQIAYAGPEYSNIVSQAIEGVGNFGQVYDQNIGSHIPRTGLNRLRSNEASSCETQGGLLLLSAAGGFDFTVDPFSDEDLGDLAEIFFRRRFNCGVPKGRGGNEDGITSFHLELCKAISAGMFGSTTKFETVFYDIGSTEAFHLLQSGEIDVLTGVESSVLRTLGSNLTQFSISPPHLFYPSADGTTEAFVSVTNAYGYRWTLLNQVAIQAIILAEQNMISQENFVDLPDHLLFADFVALVFQAIITLVGNYGEIYERTISSSLPRSQSCNQLNIAPHGPQLFPFIFDGL